MADKTKLTGLTLEASPALQKYLDHEHQLHLQMIEEQKQLEDLRKQKIQDQLEEEERRRQKKKSKKLHDKGLGKNINKKKKKRK